jgi:hypothetical protein
VVYIFFLITPGMSIISEHLVREKNWRIFVNVSGGRYGVVKKREMMR